MTVQDIVNGVSTDARQMLATTGADAAVINDWVDRVHKDCLRDSIYKNLNRGSVTLAVFPGVGTYTLVPSNIRQVLTVFDRTLDRFLTSYESVMALGNVTTGFMAQERLSLSTRTDLHELYKFSAPTTLTLFPAPPAGGSLEVHYELLVASVNGSLSATLLVPDDGRDMVTAGVNYYVNVWLQRDSQAQFWMQEYMRLKAGRPLTDSGPMAPPALPQVGGGQ